jgi:NADH-quinone oxidoreductase subunit C
MSLNLSETLKTTVEKLNDRFSESLLGVYQSSGDTFIHIHADSLIEISEFLKEELSYVILSDLFGVDRYTSEERFEVVYNLISLKDRQRLFMKVRLEEEEPELETVTNIWRSANWKEREVYDMFGIIFLNHPDLRRIYMPEDFEYFPLRKEFPLLGIPGSIELPSTTPDTD